LAIGPWGGRAGIEVDGSRSVLPRRTIGILTDHS